MDCLTALYETTARVRLEPEQLATIRWYWARPDALPFPASHAFGSNQWETDLRAYPQPGIGEVGLTIRHVKNLTPLGEFGQRTPTPLDWFRSGVPSSFGDGRPFAPCVFVAGLGTGPGSAHSLTVRQRTAGAAGWLPLSSQPGLGRQRFAAAAGWGAVVAQIAGAHQFGQLGVGWRAITPRLGHYHQSPTGGIGWTFLAAPGVVNAFTFTAGSGWQGDFAQAVGFLEGGVAAVGFAPASVQGSPRFHVMRGGFGLTPAAAHGHQARQLGQLAAGWRPDSEQIRPFHQAGRVALGSGMRSDLFQPWEKGFDLRGSSGLVTDPFNHTYSILATTYPTTRIGVTFGWTVAAQGAIDSSMVNDPRLCGYNTVNATGGNSRTFQVDLPSSGRYYLRFAVGSQAGASSPFSLQVLDGATNLYSFGHITATALGRFVDAVNVEHATAALWVTNNTERALTFTGTTARFVVGPVTSGVQPIRVAHFYLRKERPAPDRNRRQGFKGSAGTGPASVQRRGFVQAPAWGIGQGPRGRLRGYPHLQAFTAGIGNALLGDREMVPVGTIIGSGAAVAPAGWLACDGSAVSRTTYAALFAALGTTFGAGDGSTTFNLPDLRGRVPVGAGAGPGLTARALADQGGAEQHTLTEAELPPHAHRIGVRQDSSYTSGNLDLTLGTATTWSWHQSAPYGSQTGGGSDGLSWVVGAGTPHTNLQPFAAVKFFIKT